jgi:hypothetical protein
MPLTYKSKNNRHKITEILLTIIGESLPGKLHPLFSSIKLWVPVVGVRSSSFFSGIQQILLNAELLARPGPATEIGNSYNYYSF